MKKIWTLFLAATLLLSTLTSCRMPEKQDPFKEILDENPEMELPKSEIMEIDPEDIPKQELPEIEPNASDVDLIEMDEGQLAVKHKIFEYKDHNLVVMRVENHSDRDLTLTVKGTCEDIGGQAMTITKKFEGFAANWQNYILFYPEFAFDHFEYEIEYQPFTGEAYSQYIHNLKYDGLWLSQKFYYDGRPYNVMMDAGWTFDYAHNQNAWYAAEFVFFDTNGKQDIFEMDTVVLLDMVIEDGISPLKPNLGTYQNTIHRLVGVDLNTRWDTLWNTPAFAFKSSIGENFPYLPQRDTIVPYTPPQPFDDFCGILCWNAIGKYESKPPMGDFTYWPNWRELVSPPGM